MGRKHIEFHQAYEVEKVLHADGPFAGAVEQRQSEDDETGAFTSIVTFPAGWQGDWSGFDRPIELFGLRGEGSLGGARFSAGFYGFSPSGATNATYAATTETQVLVMVEDVAPLAGGTVEIQDTNEMKWADHGVEGVPPGLVIKLLRVDAEKGDWTWLAAATALWQEDRAEIHPTVEEALMLTGDILLGTRGVMSPGSYFWRVPNVEHGPMYSLEGNTIFFRTKGGGMAVTWVEVPGWRALVEEYRSRKPIYRAPA
jgi:hypothetical protein